MASISAVYILKEVYDFNLKLTAYQACHKAGIYIPEELSVYFRTQGYTEVDILALRSNVPETLRLGNAVPTKYRLDVVDEGADLPFVAIMDISLKDIPEDAVAIRVYAHED